MSLRDLFDAPVVLEEVAVAPDLEASVDLHPAERSAIAGAVPSRRAEFLAGRVAARRALRRLGEDLGAGPLLVGPDRAPAWPAGVVGSITHSGVRCAAVVGRSAELVGLGLDLEPWEPLEADLIELVLTAGERARLADPLELELGLLARRSFCAKEAVYKAVSRRAGRVLEFHEVRLAFAAGGGRFEAELPAGLGLAQVTGRTSVDGGWVAAGVALR